jgi:glycosyltransferase involved in cell wall biosynthesis
LAGRVPRGIPSRVIRAFTSFGFEYQRRRSRARSISEMTATHLWAGETFCRLILESNPTLDSDVFCFNSAGLEILQAWRGRGHLCVVEQTIAPRRFEEKILAEEHLRLPDWQEPPPHDSNVAAYIAREEAEWREADIIVCGSDFVREGVRACGGPVERCVVVPYGIDLQSFPTCKRDWTPRRPLRVLTVGEVGLRKGSPYVVEAARRLKGRVEFRMVGPMTLHSRRAKELQKHVEWLGVVPRRDIAAHYRWADVFLLPSLCEGSATVTYEALSAGLPVVTTKSSGSISVPGVTGFCVIERDSEGIVAALERFFANPQLLRDMSEAARQHSSQGSFDVYGERLIAALSHAREVQMAGVTPKQRPGSVHVG